MHKKRKTRTWHDGSKIHSKHIIAIFDDGRLVRRLSYGNHQSRWFAKCKVKSCTNVYEVSAVKTLQSRKNSCRLHSKKYVVAGMPSNSAILKSLENRVVWKNCKTKEHQYSDIRPFIKCGAENCHNFVLYTKKRNQSFLCYFHCHNANRKAPFEATFNLLKTGVRIRNAKRKNALVFDLTLSQFQQFSIENPDCFYCGKFLNRCAYTKKTPKGQRYTRAAYLDRKNIFDGYTLKNIVSCCGLCNVSRGVLLSGEEMQIIGLLRQQKWKDAKKSIERNHLKLTAWANALKAENFLEKALGRMGHMAGLRSQKK